MVETHVSVHELVAGRYRPMEVAHRETNRVSWYGEDTIAQQPCLLTEVTLPFAPDAEFAGRITAGIRRTTDVMVLLCPTRVAPVVDTVEEAGTLWTVTDWIDGTPLGQLLAQQGTFHYVRAARIGLELLDILEAAHSEGITHGELSPGQVFVRDQGGVVLTGFGLAGATLAPRITAPSYASPEQARDERIGPAADLWALGAILYTLVEGHPPFRDRGRPEATMKGVDRLPMRGPSRAGPLAQVVLSLLRKNSRERMTRPVVREALTRILDDDPYADRDPVPLPRLRRAYDAVRGAGTTWSGRGMAAGTALAVGTVTVAVLAATHQLPGTQTSASTEPSPLPSASASVGTPARTSTVTPTPRPPRRHPRPPPPRPLPRRPRPPSVRPPPPPPRRCRPASGCSRHRRASPSRCRRAGRWWRPSRRPAPTGSPSARAATRARWP